MGDFDWIQRPMLSCPAIVRDAALDERAPGGGPLAVVPFLLRSLGELELEQPGHRDGVHVGPVGEVVGAGGVDDVLQLLVGGRKLGGVAADLADEGVDPVGVRGEPRADVGVLVHVVGQRKEHRKAVPLGEEGADRLVLLERRVTHQLGELASRGAPEEVHLEESVPRVDEAEHRIAVHRLRAVDGRDVPLVVGDGHRRGQPGNAPDRDGRLGDGDGHHLLLVRRVADRGGQRGVGVVRVVGGRRDVDCRHPRGLGDGPGTIELPEDGPVRILDQTVEAVRPPDRHRHRIGLSQRDVRAATAGQQRRGDGGCGPDDSVHRTTPPLRSPVRRASRHDRFGSQVRTTGPTAR